MRRPWWWAALLTITLLYGLYAWPAEQAIRPVAHIDSAAALLRQRRLDAAATDERAAGVAHTTPDNDSVISSEGSDRTTASATVSIQGAATGETGGAGHRDSASSTGFGGPAFFSAGQSAEARRSVELAIEKQQAPKEGAFLWGNVQATVAQAEKESDNVRRLLQADDMLSWRPDLSKLPPQRPADASMEKLLEHVPRGGTAWLAFGNAGVTEMLLNWAHHVIALGYGWQMVVAAFDEALLLSLHERRIPAYNYTGALPTTHFRHAPYLFHRMGYLKADCIRLVLETGRCAPAPTTLPRACRSLARRAAKGALGGALAATLAAALAGALAGAFASALAAALAAALAVAMWQGRCPLTSSTGWSPPPGQACTRLRLGRGVGGRSAALDRIDEGRGCQHLRINGLFGSGRRSRQDPSAGLAGPVRPLARQHARGGAQYRGALVPLVRRGHQPRASVGA